MELTEAQVKKEVEDHLKLLQKSGRLWYVRLNAGVFGRHHNIQGAPKGTADFEVVQKGAIHIEYMGERKGPVAVITFVTFVECKSTTGKLRPEQEEFKVQVEKLHCRYAIVRSVEDLQEVLRRE